MEYMTVAEAAEKWSMSARTARYYCAEGRVPGAYIKGKTWSIPEDAQKPQRKNAALPDTLLERLKVEKEIKLSGGIYHRLQVDMTYNSNHIEGSRLSHDQTRYIFETDTIGAYSGAVKVDDVIEAANHFRCIDMVIDNAGRRLSESFIKELHHSLKSGTTDSRERWFAVGDYKRLPNSVGGKDTTAPGRVAVEMKKLFAEYNLKEQISLDDILDFHYRFECIHPFQDGNGRVGRLIMLKECLKAGITPFIIDEQHKMFYYRGLKEWERAPGYLRDTCLLLQDDFKAVLDYFEIKYAD